MRSVLIAICLFGSVQAAAGQPETDRFDPLSQTGPLFSDPPVNQVRRAILVQEVARASQSEKEAVMFILETCMPQDESLYKSRQKAKSYRIQCKSAVDRSSIRFGQYNPSRALDNEMETFVKVLHYVELSGNAFETIEKLDKLNWELYFQYESDVRSGRRAPDPKMTPPDYAQKMESEKTIEKEFGIYFHRAKWFVRGLVNVFQEARSVVVTETSEPPATLPVSRQTLISIQKKLFALGYDPGEADGVFGPRTESAIERFQVDHGLAVTGTASDELESLLSSLVKLKQ